VADALKTDSVALAGVAEGVRRGRACTRFRNDAIFGPRCDRSIVSRNRATPSAMRDSCRRTITRTP